MDVRAGAPLTLLNEEERLFQESVREFAEGEIRPLVEEMDRAGKFRPDLLAKLFELGLMGIEVPDALGGSDASFFMSILAVEELSRIDPSVGVVCDVQNTLVNNALLRWGTQPQRERYLPILAREWIGAYALSEAGAGSDAFALQARAESVPGGWQLTGQKLWVTNGSEAELFLVFATVDPDAGYKGITGFIVERSSPGFKVGKKEDKMGIRASSTCELVLDHCRIPAGNVLGEVGKGYRIAIETLNEGRIGIGAQMVGLARGALELATAYARERIAFGRPIADFQAIQFELAELATQLEAARLLVYNAARLKEAGADFVAAAAQAKYFSSTAAEDIASRALEIFGGYGYTRDYPIEKFYRDAKIGKIYEGTSNMQLMTIAKHLLR